MSSPFAAPTADEQAELLAEIGPLPISGTAWPAWVKGVAWLIVALMGAQIARSLGTRAGDAVQSPIGLVVIFCFLGLALVAYYMQKSITTVDERGLHQTWIMRREVAWSDIQFAKFVPLLSSKRLVVFTRRGRPIVFQGGTQDLHIAFAKISLLYRRRP